MTPQVLSISQLQFDGEARARAIGAYSMILAVGVAAGQVVGGLLVSAHLLAAAWRPALLLNAPVGVLLLLAARRHLPSMPRTHRQRLDLVGATVLSATLLAFVLPLTFGRDAGWPVWVWPSFIACMLGVCAFVVVERRVRARGGYPLFDLGLLREPGIAAGVGAVVLVMSAYAGLLISLTLYLQGSLRFTALHAGVTFSIYACGFAAASLAWTRVGASLRDRLPLLGPAVMGVALISLGAVAGAGGWPIAVIAPLLFTAGAGHACSFSPLANRMTTAVAPAQAADLSGLILTASLVGQVVGIAAFVGVYLDAAPHGAAHALELTTRVLAGALLATIACAYASRKPIRASLSTSGAAECA
jgi:MFS family permease